MTRLICPNPKCDYEGRPRREARGSTLVGVLLVIFLFPIGILYFLLLRGYRYYCPHCGIQVGADT